MENSQTTGASATMRTATMARRRASRARPARSRMAVPRRSDDADERRGHDENADDDDRADGGGGADVEEFEALFDAVDHQGVGRVRRPAAGGDEDDVEHAERVHHSEDERKK